MLSFKNSNYFLFACLLTLNVSQFIWSVSGWYYIGVGTIYIILISIGSSRVNSGFHFHVICKAKKDSKGVILSFDDGPHPEVTPKLLEVLEKHQAHAVFFVIGKSAEKHPDIIKTMMERGHIIGNHTFGHSYFFDFFAPKVMANELRRTRDVIFQMTGKRILWFRPPYGVTNPMMKRALKLTGFIPVGWSVRSLDTVITDHTRLFRRLEKTRDGDIILLHDIRKDMPEIVDRLINRLREKGLEIADAGQIMPAPPYELEREN